MYQLQEKRTSRHPENTDGSLCLSTKAAFTRKLGDYVSLVESIFQYSTTSDKKDKDSTCPCIQIWNISPGNNTHQ